MSAQRMGDFLPTDKTGRLAAIEICLGLHRVSTEDFRESFVNSRPPEEDYVLRFTRPEPEQPSANSIAERRFKHNKQLRLSC